MPYTPIKLSEHEWIKVFSDNRDGKRSKAKIKGLFRWYISEAEKEIDYLMARKSQYKRNVPDWSDRWLLEMIIKRIDNAINFLEKRIRRWQFLLARPKKGEQYNIEQAKRFPIADLYDGTLRPVGGRLQGKCPFHDDSSPSFVLYVEQNKWHCFGCGEHGDSIDFIQTRDSVGF